ncbi:hypothetical protein BDB01DRAFT_731390, partial [Pilobolus umbonatus]
LPNCLHWNVPTTRNNSVPIRYLGLSQLRRYWHVDKAQISSPPHPPQLCRPALLLKPSLWKVFWSLKMSSKAFTPWWRLSHNSIGHRIKLHRWNSSHFDTPVCGICGRANENLYHFQWDCYKPEYLSSEMAVWTALIALSKLDSKDLAMLGCAFSTLWKYHWLCVMDNIAWSRPAAVNMFKDEHHIYIQKYLDANATPV